MLPPLLVKLRNLPRSDKGRSSLAFPTAGAPVPKFVDPASRKRLQVRLRSPDIRFLNESSPPRRLLSGAAAQFLQQFLQSLMLGATKSTSPALLKISAIFAFRAVNSVSRSSNSSHVLGQNRPYYFCRRHESDKITLAFCGGRLVISLQQAHQPCDFGRSGASGDSVFFVICSARFLNEFYH